MSDPTKTDSAASQNEAPTVYASKTSTGDAGKYNWIWIALAILILALFATAAAHCQTIDGPKPQRTVDKKFVILNGWSIAANVADVVTTRQAIGRGCVESNPFFGRNPSTAKLLSVKLPISAAIFTSSYFLKKKYGKGRDSHVWAILPSISGGLFTFSAVNNSVCGR